MRRLGAVVIGLSLTTALLVWWLSSPAPAPGVPEPRPVTAPRALPPLSEGEGRIEGRVVCPHDVADLAGTELVFELHGQRATVETGADGRFVFTTSQDGTWTVSAIRAPGHVARPVETSFVLSPGVVIAGVELRVDALAAPPPTSMVSFTGIVVDEADQPVAGASVEGFTRAPTSGPRRGRAESFVLTSELDGRFSLQVAEGSIVSLKATLGTRSSPRVTVRASDECRLKLQRRESALSGRVVGADGQPLTTFQVRIRAEAFNHLKTINSPDGTYRVDGLPDVTATVEVSAAGFLGARREGVVLGAEERTGIDFTLEHGLSFSGVVLDEKTLAPLEFASIRANQLVGGMRNGAATTDDQGVFVVAGLPRGQVELRVWRKGYRGREVIVDVGTQQSARITLAPGDGSDSRQPMEYEGVGMQFESADAGQGYLVSRLHPEGGARLAGLELGDEILAADGVSAGSVPIEAFMRRIKGPEGTVVTLTVRRGGRTFDLHAARRRLHWAP